MAMASLDMFVGKYIRLTDDLHEMRAYLNDIRICFVALTVSCYVGIIVYALLLCMKRRGGDDSSDNGSRFRHNSQQPSQQNRRSQSRFADAGSNYDAEAGGGGQGGQNQNTNNDWDDMMPPPPNGSAVKTLDGYRYRNPRRGSQQKPAFQSQNRLSVQMDSADTNTILGGGKRQQLMIDNHAGTAAHMTASTPPGGGQALFSIGRRSPSDNFRDGFIEKSPSVT